MRMLLDLMLLNLMSRAAANASWNIEFPTHDAADDDYNALNSSRSMIKCDSSDGFPLSLIRIFFSDLHWTRRYCMQRRRRRQRLCPEPMMFLSPLHVGSMSRAIFSSSPRLININTYISGSLRLHSDGWWAKENFSLFIFHSVSNTTFFSSSAYPPPPAQLVDSRSKVLLISCFAAKNPSRKIFGALKRFP